MAAATSVTSTVNNNHLESHFQKAWRVSGTLDEANLIDAAGVTSTFTVTATAAAGGDFTLGDAVIACSASTDLLGVTVTPYVSATGVVSVRVQNESGSAYDMASTVFKFLVVRFAA